LIGEGWWFGNPEPVPCFSFVLGVFEFGQGFGALAPESGFLDVQVAEGFFVFEVGFRLD